MDRINHEEKKKKKRLSEPYANVIRNGEVAVCAVAVMLLRNTDM